MKGILCNECNSPILLRNWLNVNNLSGFKSNENLRNSESNFDFTTSLDGILIDDVFECIPPEEECPIVLNPVEEGDDEDAFEPGDRLVHDDIVCN